MIKIGKFTATRPWQSISYANPPSGFEYVRAVDFPFSKFKIENQFLNQTKWAINERWLDGILTYNSIYHRASKPWIVEVESTLPRYGNAKGWQEKYAVKQLSQENCRAISFTSQYSWDLNTEFLKKYNLGYKAVRNYRPVIPTIESGQGRQISDEFRILFVGNAFWRKGGLQLLRAFQRVSKDHWRLQIISTFETDWSIYPHEIEKEEVWKIISSNPKISIMSSVPFDVMSTYYRDSDVLVGFTYADPWYNSIMEAGAHGLALITSGVSSTTEMVSHNTNGFVYTEDFSEQGKVKSAMSPRPEHEEWIAHMLEKYDGNKSLLSSHQSASLEMHKEKFSMAKRNENLKAFFNF